LRYRDDSSSFFCLPNGAVGRLGASPHQRTSWLLTDLLITLTTDQPGDCSQVILFPASIPSLLEIEDTHDPENKKDVNRMEYAKQQRRAEDQKGCVGHRSNPKQDAVDQDIHPTRTSPPKPPSPLPFFFGRQGLVTRLLPENRIWIEVRKASKNPGM
jgi:hypothetical protein